MTAVEERIVRGSDIDKGDTILSLEDMKKHFTTGEGVVKAVDGLDLDVVKGETLGLVGESGCGKSTAGRTVVKLHPVTEGRITYKGQDIETLTGSDELWYHRQVQMIFQDPQASLNPRMTVLDIIGEALDVHQLVPNRKARRERVVQLLELVGLNSEHANRYPHEFSGGQRQRIGVARALAVDPEFIVADEPISALDVSVQAQVVNLLQRLQDERDLTYVFIAHDLSMVRQISDRVAVMYLGKLMELADSADIYEDPLHPYTQALLSAVPVPDPEVEAERERIVLSGDVPSPIDPPRGCPFNTRCPMAEDICFEEEPEYTEVAPGRWAACHLVDEG